MQKFKTNHGRITLVEVDRETDKCVFIGRKRELKDGPYGCYFDTFEAAKEQIVSECQASLRRFERELVRDQEMVHYCKSELEKARAIQGVSSF